MVGKETLRKKQRIQKQGHYGNKTMGERIRLYKGRKVFSGWRKRGRGNIHLEAMLPPQVVTERKILKQPRRVVLFFLLFCHSYPLPLTFIKRINLSSSPLMIMWVIKDLGFAFSLVLNAISPGSHLIIFCKL